MFVFIRMPRIFQPPNKLYFGRALQLFLSKMKVKAPLGRREKARVQLPSVPPLPPPLSNKLGYCYSNKKGGAAGPLAGWLPEDTIIFRGVSLFCAFCSL